MNKREDLNDNDDDDRQHRRWFPLVAGIAICVGFVALVYATVSSLSSHTPPPKQVIQQISIIQPPPPPPPPPEMEPPPEPEQVEMQEPEPEPLAEEPESDEPLPGDELGLDADGVAGADGFGLRAKKGGRGLIGGGDPNRWYAGVIQTDLQRLLAENDDVRRGRYAIVVKIWIDEEGGLKASELVTGSGDETIDSTIKRVLQSDFRISQAPPVDLPQPIKLRISSRI